MLESFIFKDYWPEYGYNNFYTIDRVRLLFSTRYSYSIASYGVAFYSSSLTFFSLFLTTGNTISTYSIGLKLAAFYRKNFSKASLLDKNYISSVIVVLGGQVSFFPSSNLGKSKIPTLSTLMLSF